MIWWVSQPARAQTEREAVADLQERSDWLRDVRWKICEDAQLAADFDISVDGEVSRLTITYPDFFPELPPMVTSRDGVRLSSHQYGPSGELCLEYRPENWDPSLSGSVQIESAFRLISRERPSPQNIRAEVPSAHRLTDGQRLRGEFARVVVVPKALMALRNIPERQAVPIALVERVHANTFVAQVERVGTAEDPSWVTSVIPGGQKIHAFALRLPNNTISSDLVSYDDLLRLTDNDDLREIHTRLRGDPLEHLLLVGPDWTRLVWTSDSDGKERVIFKYETVLAPEPASRLPCSHSHLGTAHVGIVGCGSVGSKIASMLARSGVGRFTLVDDDVLFEGNLVRNDLDGRSIGTHKADALKVRLKEINPSVSVNTRRVRLGGQESASLTSLVMQELSGCNLLIDATADVVSFRLVGVVARTHEKPLIWVEVLAGGIGGVVARCRPGLEPFPHLARMQIEQWCEQHGVAGPVSESGYDATSTNGLPLVADDTDVTVIAGHAARLAIDTLVRPAGSSFPHAAYAIGLTSAWIFTAPFDVWPIELGPPAQWGSPGEEEDKEILTSLLKELLLTERTNAGSSAD